MKKILFLSNQLPNNFDAGGILYSDIIKDYDIEKFSFLSLVHPIRIKDFNIKSKNLIRQYSLRITRTSILNKILIKVPLIETIYFYFNLIRFRKEILNKIINENFDSIFAPLRGEVLLILPFIIKKTKLPVYAMVEDTVEAEINDPKILYYQKKKSYYNLLNKVVNLGVAGESMKIFFKTNFNIDSVILRPSFKKFTNCYPKFIKNEFNIFFAGNTYAENELKAFIISLEKFVLHSNLKLTFYIASHKSFKTNSSKLIINNLGWLSQKKLNDYMNKCHIAYLPYKSEPKFKHQMMYAFPGKSGFYISNNLPVFFHGPKYSSFNKLLDEFKLGVSCDSLNSNILLSEIKRFTNNSFYLKCQNECLNAFNKKFSKKIFSKSVSLFFNNQ